MDRFNDEFSAVTYGAAVDYAAEGLEKKANTDGSYDLMTVGEAKALVGRGDGTAQQFVFRPTGGNESVGSGKARINRIKGNTVVFNQLANAVLHNGVDVTATGNYRNATLTFNKTESGRGECAIGYFTDNNLTLFTIQNHKYYVSAKILSTVTISNSVTLWCGGSSSAIFSLSAGVAIIKNSILTATRPQASNVRLIVNGPLNVSIGDTITVTNFKCIDLTKMFGAGNEPSTAEEFEALYPNAYYEYNTGELVNVTATGIKTVGFNAYNPTTHTAELLGGKQYQITGAYTAVSYSTGETLTPDANGKFTPSANGTLTVTGYGADTCVHLVHSGYMDGEFEEHWDETKALPIATYFADGMKSAGSAYDELQGGKAIKRVGTRAYQSGDESDSSVVTDGTNTNYALATPVETAITTPLDLVYRVDDFGTEQEIATGASAPFKADIAYAMNAVDFIRNAPKNYISKESMDEFTAALSTALNKTITATWNATTNRYNFTITDNQA